MPLIVLLLCVLAALLELDNTSLGQTGFGRAFVSGIIFGLCTGNIFTGLEFGLFIELLFLDYTPVGGVLPPNGTVAAFFAVMAYFFGWPQGFAFTFGIAAGMFFRYFDGVLRTANGHLLLHHMIKIDDDPVKMTYKFLFSAAALQFLVNFAAIAVTVFILRKIIFHTPQPSEKLLTAFSFAYWTVPWMGLILLVKKFVFKVR